MSRVRLAGAVAFLAAAFVSSSSFATTYTVSSLSNAPGSVAGYDGDKPAPTVTAQGFYASGGVGDYNSVRFTPDAIGLSGLTLSQITSIAYDHAQAGGGTDWQLKVYTVGSAGTGGGWYGYRLNYDLSTANSDGSFSTFTDTNEGAERLNTYANRATPTYNVSTPSAFASLLAAAGNEQVLFFDISAGASNGGYAYNTFLNNITINTSIGSSTLATAVPLPTAAMASTSLLALTALRRRR